MNLAAFAVDAHSVSVLGIGIGAHHAAVVVKGVNRLDRHGDAAVPGRLDSLQTGVPAGNSVGIGILHPGRLDAVGVAVFPGGDQPPVLIGVLHPVAHLSGSVLEPHIGDTLVQGGQQHLLPGGIGDGTQVVSVIGIGNLRPIGSGQRRQKSLPVIGEGEGPAAAVGHRLQPVIHIGHIHVVFV